MISKINHIGIAVQSLTEQIPFYRDVLKLEFSGTEEVTDQKVKVAIFRVGDVQIELLEPMSPDSPIAAFLDKKGPGIHHIAYQTDNIKIQLADLKGRGMQLIDEEPRPGAHGSQIAFIHPRSSGKILTEICQAKG